MDLALADLDLAALATHLTNVFGGGVEGYMRGRTAFRDSVSDHLQCSLLEAEEIVDTMVTRGFLQFRGDPSDATGGEGWMIRPSAS